MRTCPGCGAQRDESLWACPSCGADLPAQRQRSFSGAILDSEWFGRLRENLLLERTLLGSARVIAFSLIRSFGVAIAVVLAILAIAYMTVQYGSH